MFGKPSTILLAVLVAGCSDRAPTAATAMPADAQLTVGANNKQRTQSIEGLVAAIEAAGAAGDAAAYVSFFSEDVEVIAATGAIVSGRAAYQAYVESGISGGSNQDITIRRVQFLTGTIAVVDVDIVFTSVTALPPGLTPTEPGVLRTRGRWVVVKRGGDWQIIAVQTTPIPPASAGFPALQ